MRDFALQNGNQNRQPEAATRSGSQNRQKEAAKKMREGKEGGQTKFS